MHKRYRRGLVVGKFCPLHQGHEFLIQRARAECDEVLVISYTKPGFDGFDCAKRELWIRTLFPELQVLCLDDVRLAATCAELGLEQRVLPFDADEDRAHREFVAWICTHILRVRVDALFTSEDYGDGFAHVMSDSFSTFDQRNHSVVHVCVDKSRQHVSISGTDLRSDIFQHRSWLSPAVYESFVQRICLLGGESTGKTTLASELARAFNTIWVPEYGRELWEVQLGQLEYADMLHIAQMQIERESLATTDADKWLFCDTSPLTTYFYSQEMFGRVDPALELAATRPYDVVVLCSPDFPFVQDGTRKGEEFRQKQHAWYLNQLRSRDIEFTLLEGSMTERTSMMTSLLNGRDKSMTHADSG